jgi:hypothetical protein
VELDWIKALPGGEEANFVMVSCVGAGLTGQTRRKMVAAKRCARLLPASSFLSARTSARTACGEAPHVVHDTQLSSILGATSQTRQSLHNCASKAGLNGQPCEPLLVGRAVSCSIPPAAHQQHLLSRTVL